MDQLDLGSITIPPLYIEALIRRGETLTVEFKSDQADFSDRHIYESAVAMSNTEGGIIIIGVGDDCSVQGSERLRTGKINKDSVVGIIHANTLPACPTVADVVEINSKQLLVIRVSASPTVVGTRKGQYLKRSLNSKGKPQNQPMSSDEIMQSIGRMGVRDFSATIFHDASLVDIDLELVASTARMRLAQVADPGQRAILSLAPESLLISRGLVRAADRKPNIACLLLFGTADSLRTRLPNHILQYQVFGRRGEMLKNDFLRDPIAGLFSKLLQLPELLRNSDEFTLKGQTVVIPEYPEKSRREAFANAIVHRDYTLQPGIQIQLYEQEILIKSPGPFPSGVNIANLLNVPPTPRNRTLAEAMSFFGFVESSGRGIDFIFQGQAQYGRPCPDYTGSSNDHVEVRLTGGRANLDFCRFIVSSIPDPTISELLILNSLFFKRDKTLPQLVEVVQRPASHVEEILVGLNRRNLVEITSERPPRYLLKGSVHASVARAIKPARMNKQDMVGFKTRLVNELKRHSPNSVGNLSDLTGISIPQARRLLGQLKDEKQVKLTNKKWAYIAK
jgi:ATP-dependent DNA helicase RecG